MKKVFSLLAVALMATTASAQIVSSNSRNVTSEPGDYPAYNRLSISYQQLKLTNAGYDSEGANGVNVEFLHGFNVMKTQPLYVETGIDASYTIKDDFQAVRIGVPVNVAYKYTFQSVNVWVQPFAGLDLICNAYVKEDGGLKRVQGGWHAGANIGYEKVNLGIKYGSDFTNMFEGGTKAKIFSIGLGYNF